MRKSFWLISAGMAALATPAAAQDQAPPVVEATPTQEAASVDDVVQDEVGAQDTDDALIVTATRRNEGPPRRVGGHRPGAGEFGRRRHPSAPAAVAVVARLLDPVGSRREQRPHPRHRHGGRQSGPRKLGRGVHRRRLPLAQRHGAHRAGPGRADRGAARTTGHAVRPQRLGRHHLGDHGGAEVRK